MSHMQAAGGKPATSQDRKIEIFIGALVTVVATAAIIVSHNFPSTGLATDIGSARFPLVYSCALIVLSMILIARNWIKRGEHSAAADSSEAKPQHSKTILGVVSSVLCLILLPILGYLMINTVFMSFLMWLLGMRHKLWNPVLAILITGVLYLTFSMALHVPLPVGSLFE